MNRRLSQLIACTLAACLAAQSAIASVSAVPPSYSLHHSVSSPWFGCQALSPSSLGFRLSFQGPLTAEQFRRESRLETGLPIDEAHLPASRFSAEGKSVVVALKLGKVTRMPGEQMLTQTQTFVLRRGKEAVLEGEFRWILDYVYLRVGSRWVRFKAPNTGKNGLSPIEGKNLPWSDLLTGSLLLGNPNLQRFLGISSLSVKRILSELPSGFQSIAEIRGFLNSRYQASDMERALTTLSTIHPFKEYKEGSLTEKRLVQFLDAFMTLSHAQFAESEVWNAARLQINLLVGAFKDVPANKLADPKLLHLLRIQGEKRKLGFDSLIFDLAESIRNVVTSVIEPNGEIFLLKKDGSVGRVDAINDGNWVVRGKARQANDLEQEARAGNYIRFSVPYLFFAGNATRMRDEAFGNKVTANLFWADEKLASALVRALRDVGYGRLAETLQETAGAIQISMFHLLALIWPEGVYCTGNSSLADAEGILGPENYVVQGISHQVNTDGSLDESKTDLAGHGEAVWEFLAKKSAVDAAVAMAGVITLANGEFYDASLHAIISMLVVQGKAVMPVVVVKQPVTFLGPNPAVQAAIKRGAKVVLKAGGSAEPVEVKAVNPDGDLVLEDGRIFPVKTPLSEAEAHWSRIQKNIEEVDHQKDPVARHDMMLDAIADFEDHIVKPLSAKIYVEGDKTDLGLFEIKYYAGGMLAEVGKTVTFIENSQFGKTHVLLKSDGTKMKVSKTAIVAVYFRDFNPNFFGSDSFVFKACMRNEAQAIYHQYASQLKKGPDSSAQETLRLETAKRLNEVTAKIDPDKWTRQAEDLQFLATVLLVPPMEAKEKNGAFTTKFNKLAQNVTCFLVAMALSNVTAEDIDMEVLREAAKALNAATSETERTKIRNGITFLNGKTFAKDLKPFLDEEQIPDERQLVICPDGKYMQVKVPSDTRRFADLWNLAQQVMTGEVVLKESTEARIRWAGIVNFTKLLLSAEAFDLALAKTITWAAWREAESGDSERSPWESSLIKEFRALAVNGVANDQWQGWIDFAKRWSDVTPDASEAVSVERAFPKRVTVGAWAWVGRHLQKAGASFMGAVLALGALEGMLTGGVIHSGHAHVWAALAISSLATIVIPHLFGVYVKSPVTKQMESVSILALFNGRAAELGITPKDFIRAYGGAVGIASTSLLSVVPVYFGAPAWLVMLTAILPHLILNLPAAAQNDADSRGRLQALKAVATSV